MQSLASCQQRVSRWLPFVVERLGRLSRAVDGVLFPPHCPCCGRYVQAATTLCAACWRGLSFITAPCCDLYATPFAVDTGVALSPEAYRYPPPWSGARAAVLYNATAVKLVHALKYEDRHDVPGLIARLMVRAGAPFLHACDVIVPVPLHWRRHLMRRYNQADLLAVALARLARRPVLLKTLKRRRATVSQVGLTRAGRARNVRHAFYLPAADALKGQSVLLVDDVMTTGATLAAATRACLKAGAARVHVLVFARVCEPIE